MIIPPDINNRDRLEAARFYRDHLGWTVHALLGPDDGSETERGKKPVEKGWKSRKREDSTDAYLLKYFGNGKKHRNLGLVVQPPHIVVDLDSKADNGESVRRWLADHPEVARCPRELTTGGAHLHLICRDVPPAVVELAGKQQKVEVRLNNAVTCEIFFGGNIVLTPSQHKSGKIYTWEQAGPIPEMPWSELSGVFGVSPPEAETSPPDSKKRAGLFWTTRFKGDLRSLDLPKLAESMGLQPRLVDADTGKHALRCPWSDTHTTKADPRNDTGTIIFDARNGHMPAFKCLHVAHGEKSLADLLNWAEDRRPGVVDEHCARTAAWQDGQESVDGRPRLLLPCTDRPHSEFASDAGKILGAVEANERLYIRHDIPVEIRELPLATSFRSLGFSPLKPVRAITHIEKFAELGQLAKDDFGRCVFMARSMGKQTAETLLHASQFKDCLPEVDRILDVPQPILRPDNTIGYPTPGYDPSFRTYLNPSAPVIRPLSLSEAKVLLRQLFSEFCFADGQSIVHALAAFITPFCRGLFGRWNARTPVWLYKANRERAGKDYCANLSSILYEGHPNEDAPLESDDAETRKKITASLLAGRRRLHFANCRGYINSAALEMLATAAIWTDRCLGENREATLPNELELSLSANTGITYTPDFANRCRIIFLHYSEENANARRFACADLHGWLLANRGLFVSALAALVNHWDMQGRPEGPTVFTSFPLWAKVVGGIMHAAGMGDPCLPHEEDHSIDGDRKTTDMKTLFAVARERFGDDWVRKELIFELVQNTGVEIFTWLDLEKKADRIKLGITLHKYKGRILGGVRLNVNETSGRSQRFTYQFETVSDGSPRHERATLFDNVFGGQVGHVGHVCNPSAATRRADESARKEDRRQGQRTPGRAKVANIANIAIAIVQCNIRALPAIAAALSAATGPIALDIETYGERGGELNPWKGHIRLLTLAVPGTEPWLLDLQAIGYDLGPLAPVLASATILGHNLKFDALWLARKCGLRLPRLLDTMTASRLLTAGTHEKNDLESLAQRHLGVQLDKEPGRAPWGGTLAPAQLRYAAEDVAHLHALHDALARELAAADLTDVYRQEMELLPHIIDMELRGFPVEPDQLRQLLATANREREEAGSNLRTLFGNPLLNPASTPQLKAALQGKGVLVASTSEEALIQSGDQTYVPAILAFRAATKRAQQAESLLDAVAPDGRIHARFEPMGTDTGRFSSRDPNLQNIERGPVRAAFAAPEGYALVVADYSQIELRVAASISRETRMIEAYRNGLDLHRQTAAIVLGKNPEAVTKDDRQLAKAVNFGLLYGQSARGLVAYAKKSYGVELSEARAHEIRDRFFGAYQTLKAWQDRNYAESATRTEVRTISGRRQLLPQGAGNQWPRFASSLNTPVQGGAAEGIKRAIPLIAQRLPPDAGLISTVHDELIVLAPADQAEAVKTILSAAMTEAMSALFPDVPIETEAKVCKTWGDK